MAPAAAGHKVSCVPESKHFQVRKGLCLGLLGVFFVCVFLIEPIAVKT